MLRCLYKYSPKILHRKIQLHDVAWFQILVIFLVIFIDIHWYSSTVQFDDSWWCQFHPNTGISPPSLLSARRLHPCLLAPTTPQDALGSGCPFHHPTMPSWPSRQARQGDFDSIIEWKLQAFSTQHILCNSMYLDVFEQTARNHQLWYRHTIIELSQWYPMSGCLTSPNSCSAYHLAARQRAAWTWTRAKETISTNSS